MIEAVLDKERRQSACPARNREDEFAVTGWWAIATPGVRVAYSLVLAVMMAGGIYMGQDLWKNKTTTNVTVSYDNDYPGINAFVTMQPGSIEQTYFDLTSYGTGRGGK
jgi:hypothetical protein